MDNCVHRNFPKLVGSLTWMIVRIVSRELTMVSQVTMDADAGMLFSWQDPNPFGWRSTAVCPRWPQRLTVGKEAWWPTCFKIHWLFRYALCIFRRYYGNGKMWWLISQSSNQEERYMLPEEHLQAMAIPQIAECAGQEPFPHIRCPLTGTQKKSLAGKRFSAWLRWHCCPKCKARCRSLEREFMAPMSKHPLTKYRISIHRAEIYPKCDTNFHLKCIPAVFFKHGTWTWTCGKGYNLALETIIFGVYLNFKWCS